MSNIICQQAGFGCIEDDPNIETGMHICTGSKAGWQIINVSLIEIRNYAENLDNHKN